MKVNGNGQVMLAGILWGTIGIFIWYMERAGASVEWISFLRVFFSWLILVAFVCWRNGPASMKVKPEIMAYCALLGLICHGIYNIFYSLAVTSIGVSLSAVLLNVATVFTAVFSALFFQENDIAAFRTTQAQQLGVTVAQSNRNAAFTCPRVAVVI